MKRQVVEIVNGKMVTTYVELGKAKPYMVTLMMGQRKVGPSNDDRTGDGTRQT